MKEGGLGAVDTQRGASGDSSALPKTWKDEPLTVIMAAVCLRHHGNDARQTQLRQKITGKFLAAPN